MNKLGEILTQVVCYGAIIAALGIGLLGLGALL